MSTVPIRQRFSSSIPCRVCRKGSSACAERIDGLIDCFHARSSEDAPPGWLFVRLLGANMGGLWAPKSLISGDSISDWGDSEPLQLPTPKGKRKPKSKKAEAAASADEAEQAAKADELPEESRAKHHRNLSRQLELSDAHRQELMDKRGLSGEQVAKLERDGFRSIEQGKRFPGVKGPGFLDDGQYVGPAGLLIPARNDQGQIVGYQVAPDHPGEGGKYKWISGPIHKVGIEGEWPVFHGHSGKASEEVYLVDGALKAALTGAQYEVPTLGVPGARFTTSGKQLLRVLNRIMPPTQDVRMVLLMPDAGDVVNLADMPSNLLATASFLREHGFAVRFGWWGQVSKDGGLDIDERLVVHAEGGSQVERLTPDEFHQIVVNTVGKAPRRTFTSPKIGVHWVANATELPTLEITPPPREGYQFAKGQRGEVLQTLQKQGVRFTLDRSKPGSGKSWDITKSNPRDYGAAQIVMVARRALDVAGEFGIAALRGKDAGRMFNEARRLVRAPVGTAPEDLVLEPNCQLAELVDSYLQRGMTLHSSNICRSCPHKHKCATTAGMFKHDKKATLAEAVYVCEPEGLDFSTFCDSKGKPWMDPTTQDPGVVLMIDESAAMPWVETLVVTADDLLAHNIQMGRPSNRRRMNASFLKVLDVLAQLMVSPEREKPAIPHQEVMDAIEARIREGEVEVADAFEIAILEETILSSEENDLQAAWCTPLLEALFGRGRVWIDGSNLHLMRPNLRFIEALHHPAVRQVVFFDGTGAVSELEGWIGEHIEVIEERVPGEQAELVIHQYVGLGRMGFSRQKVQEKQADLLMKQLRDTETITRDTPTVDIKNTGLSRSRRPLTWLSTSRGSNAAAKAKDLVLVGAPGPNLVSALNRYCLLYGVDLNVEDTGFFNRRFWTPSATRNEGGGLFVETSRESTHFGFRNYYRALVEAELDQALHRLRGVRRPGEVLHVHWISDFCHPRWEVNVVRAEEVVDLFTPIGLSVETVRFALRRLAKEGNARPSHHQVAKAIGVRSSDVTRWLESSGHIAEEFGWLDRSKRGLTTVTEEQARSAEPIHRRPPLEPVPDEMLVRMRELLPVGTTVTCVYDRSARGTIVEYRLERGIGKFVVEMTDGTRKAFPRNLLTFPAQVA